jgi:hypothetical protein
MKMNNEEAKKHLLDTLADAVDDRINFVVMGYMFPPETREQSVAALRQLGYKQAGDLLDSITGEHSLSRLWD